MGDQAPPDRTAPTPKPGVLAQLRALTPQRPIGFIEGLLLAELQANRLLALSGVTGPPVPDDLVTRLPRITVEYLDDMPASGSTGWNSRNRQWIIFVHKAERPARRRATILHEFKHIIDHPHQRYLYSRKPVLGYGQRELFAIYFANCVLMPDRWVRQAWQTTIHTPSELARHHRVERRSALRRLSDLGLLHPPLDGLAVEVSEATSYDDTDDIPDDIGAAI